MNASHGGPIDQSVRLEDFTQKECPISIMSHHPVMEMMAREVIQTMALKQATGALTYGLDPSEWSCQWHDAIQMFVSEEGRIKDAITAFQRELT